MASVSQILIPALAAIAVAVIAASTANKRQTRALTAEAEREGQRLAHDRQLKDLDGFRTLLEDCSRWMTEIAARMTEVDMYASLKGAGSDEAAEGQWRKKIGEVQKLQWDAALNLEMRLLLHVPANDPLYTSFHRFSQCQVDRLGRHLNDDKEADVAESSGSSEGKDACATSGEAARRFREVARLRAAFVLPASVVDDEEAPKPSTA